METEERKKIFRMMIVLVSFLLIPSTALATDTIVSAQLYLSTGVPSTQMTISDITNQLIDNKFTDATFTIFADYEYTNNTNVLDAICTVSGDITGVLSYNGTVYTSTAKISTVGNYSYTIDCSKESHQSQLDTDIFTTQDAISCGWCGLFGTCDYFIGNCVADTKLKSGDIAPITADVLGNVGVEFIKLAGLIVVVAVLSWLVGKGKSIQRAI